MAVELSAEPPFWVHILLWLPLTTIAVIFSLRLAKGALLALEYRHRAREGRIADAPPGAPLGATTGAGDLEDWNRLGRSYSSAQSARLRDFHEGRTAEFAHEDDPRSPELAEAVLAEVRRLNREGLWRQARERFDPAHAPFIPTLEARGRNLPCAITLGPDQFLLRLGANYQSGEMVLIDGDTLRPLPGMLAAAISADRSALLVVDDSGFEVRPDLDGSPTAHFPWPTDWSGRLDQLHVDNGGRTIAFAHDDLGVWVGTTSAGGASWTRVHPDEQMLADLASEAVEEGEDELDWSDSMTHCGLSADGRFVSYGSQCSSHCLDRIEDSGLITRHATAEPVSSYPHDACLSHDGAFVAFNACHFYNGATVAAATAQIEGKALQPDDAAAPVINTYLRVYASTWLPAEAIGEASGAFALAGSGFLTCVTPQGKVVFEQEFGSSASAIDYCPSSRRLILSSYSGCLHVYDIDAVEPDDRVIGMNARRELYRWVFWQDGEPFRW